MDFTRQSDVVTPDDLAFNIALVGAGATGSFTLLNLFKMGCQHVDLYDTDTVEEHNLPNQFVPVDSVGEPKVDAVSRAVENVTGKTPNKYNRKFEGGSPDSNLLITAIDSLEARKTIWDNLDPDGLDYIIDPRMGLDQGSIYIIDPMDFERAEYYQQSLTHDPAELPCTARSIVYAPNIIGGLIAAAVKAYSAAERLPREILLLAYDYQVQPQYDEDYE